MQLRPSWRVLGLHAEMGGRCSRAERVELLGRGRLHLGVGLRGSGEGGGRHHLRSRGRWRVVEITASTWKIVVPIWWCRKLIEERRPRCSAAPEERGRIFLVLLIAVAENIVLLRRTVEQVVGLRHLGMYARI